MGLKFLCHLCQQPIHIKDSFAGKRGKCPHCGGSIRIPADGESHSLPITVKPTTTLSETSAASYAAIALPAAEVAAKPASFELQPTAANADSATINSNAIANANKMPQVIAEAPNAAWYVRPPSGGQYGPAVGAVFWDWLNEKRVGENSLVWREGWGTWQPAKEAFPEFFKTTPNTTPVPKVALSTPVAVAPVPVAPSAIRNPDKPTPANSGSNSALPLDPTMETRRTVQVRRRRSHSQNLVLLVSLSLVALVLIIALVAVLVMQNRR